MFFFVWNIRKYDFQFPHLVFDLSVDISKSGMVSGSQRHLYCSVGPTVRKGVSNYCHLHQGQKCHELPPFLDSHSSKKSNTLNQLICYLKNRQLPQKKNQTASRCLVANNKPLKSPKKKKTDPPPSWPKVLRPQAKKHGPRDHGNHPCQLELHTLALRWWFL